MKGPYVHRIDPIIADVGGVYLWWYGLSYALGFFQIFLFLRRHRAPLGLTMAEVYSLTLFFSVGVLVGGRAVEVFFDEWDREEAPGTGIASRSSRCCCSVSRFRATGRRMCRHITPAVTADSVTRGCTRRSIPRHRRRLRCAETPARSPKAKGTNFRSPSRGGSG